MRHHGYTLVEVLAVTVVLGLLAGIGVPPLVRTIAGDPLARASATLARDLRDARAAAFGRPLALTLAADGFASADGRPSASRLPATVQAEWRRDSRTATRLELDRRGHGPDTALILRHEGRELRYAIDGLTGRWTRLDER
jgi:prepilin-type N-terminal cleavage/methylation domain-containing protein